MIHPSPRIFRNSPASKSPQISGAGCLLALALALLLPACTADTASAPTPATPKSPATQAAPPAKSPASNPAPDAPTPMSFDTTPMTIKGKAFTVEVATSQAQIERGLMYRNSMPDDHGMLFVMEYPDTWSFWMKNTRIPLDIIYLDKNGRVVDITHRRPFDETGVSPRQPALYIIELNVGMAEKIGLVRNDVVEIPAKYLKTQPATTEK